MFFLVFKSNTKSEQYHMFFFGMLTMPYTPYQLYEFLSVAEVGQLLGGN